VSDNKHDDAHGTVALKVRLGYASAGEFVRKFAAHVTRSGFFLPTREVKPVGTPVRFDLALQTGETMLSGVGVVFRVTQPGPGEAGAPGIVVQFTSLDPASQAMLDRMAGPRQRPAQAPAAPPPQPPHPSAAAGAPSDPPPPTLTPTPPPLPSSGLRPVEPAAAAPAQTPAPAQADLTVAHAVQQVAKGKLALDLGLPSEPQPPATPSRAVIGIDLGTTNSCAAIVKDGKPYIIPSREGHNTVPSIVALNPRGKLVVGHLGKAQLLSSPRETLYGTKRLVGRRFESKAVQQIRETFPYPVVESEDGLAAVEIGGHQLSLEQVSALILREVREVAQNHLGEEVNRAVITVPAYYNERQREAVRQAGALAGLQVERIVNEPTAAALAYAYGRRLRQRVLVYDLGGGTFDASILELQENVYEVISTGGDTFLGGVDFDDRIVARLLEIYEKQVGQPFDGDHVALSRLIDAAERTKCALSERQEFHIHLPFIAMKDGQPVALDTTLTRAEVVELVRPLVERTLDVCREVLAAKGLTPQDLDEVILVGGQSRMPLVHELVRGYFDRAPSRSVHPDEAVAIGAALLAHTLSTAEGVVLIDVLPMSIGIATPEGTVRPVFERNTPLPSRKNYALATTRDGQTEFELTVVQGDAPVADDCEYLGTVRLDNLPSGPRGMVKIAVGFELGAESLLTVTAREQQTNRVVKASFAPRPRSQRSPPNEAVRKPANAAAAGQALGRPPADPRRGWKGVFRKLFGRAEAQS
jgi:molecular chaperone DnaK